MCIYLGISKSLCCTPETVDSLGFLTVESPWKPIYIYIYIAELLCCTSETL